MKILEIQKITQSTSVPLPLLVTSVSAGFPSPAEDHIEKSLDLNEHLIQHPASTFFVRVEGESMIDAGIHSGDTLIVDKALEAKDKSIVVAVINGEFTVKRIRFKQQKVYLQAENDRYPTIPVDNSMEFQVWGVVTNVIRNLG